MINASKQLAEVAEMCGMSPKDYATALRKEFLPNDSDTVCARIISQIYSSRCCPFLGLSNVMGVGKRKQLALSYDGWIFAGHRAGVTGISTEIVETDERGTACTVTICKGVDEQGEPRKFQRTEYLEENKRPTDNWKKMPMRMLQHRAIISGIRCACPVINTMASVDELMEAGFKPVGDEAPQPETKASSPKVKIRGKGKLSVSEQEAVE